MHDGHTPGYYTNIMKEWGVEHKLVKTNRFISLYEDLIYLSSIYKILKKEKYDLVINIATKPNIYGSIAAKWTGVKKIVCFGWGLGLTFEKSKKIGRIILRYILNALYWYAFKVSSIVWFTNKNDLDYFASKKIINPSKAFVTKGFIDTKLYSPDAVSSKESANLKEELGYKTEDKIIILVARMSWAKGIKQFCESSDLLRKNYPEVKFLLVGQSDSGSPDSVPESYINRYEQYENFQHLGYRIDIRELYSISYLAVFPSYYREGGWPRGLIEPMAMGKPVITSDNKHCSAAVIDGYNGLVVPIKNSKALSNGIELIVKDKVLAEKFGLRSRNKTLEDLDEEMIMQELVKAIL
jgi:glycosyltransferase involved in cell wall biosynthesis